MTTPPSLLSRRALVGAGVGLALGCRRAAEGTTPPALAADFTPLRAHFDAARERARLLALLSPT